MNYVSWEFTRSTVELTYLPFLMSSTWIRKSQWLNVAQPLGTEITRNIFTCIASS